MPWRTFLAGLAGTRQQVTYALVGAYLAVLLRGLSLVSSVREAAELMDAMEIVVMAAMVYWFGGKWLEQHGNGRPAAGSQGSAAADGKAGAAPGASAAGLDPSR